LSLDEKRWVELHKGVTVLDMNVRIDIPCSAYDGLCTIYENRPTICRQYPTQPGLDEDCAYTFE
jgi:Fe-S-cluster containining protein